MPPSDASSAERSSDHRVGKSVIEHRGELRTVLHGGNFPECARGVAAENQVVVNNPAENRAVHPGSASMSTLSAPQFVSCLGQSGSSRRNPATRNAGRQFSRRYLSRLLTLRERIPNGQLEHWQFYSEAAALPFFRCDLDLGSMGGGNRFHD